jgi:hypothetical protein
VLLPRRRAIGRGFGWVSRFRRLGRDYERLLETLAGLSKQKIPTFNRMVMKLRFVDGNCNVRFTGMRRTGFLAACYLLSNNFLDVSLLSFR